MCSASTTRWSPANLSAALKFYTDREHEGAHDALADVEATADVLLAQLDRYPDLLAWQCGLPWRTER
jgi:DNA polymerase III epsilon subunit-like protein